MAVTDGLGLVLPLARVTTPTNGAQARPVIALAGRAGSAARSTGGMVLAIAGVVAVRSSLALLVAFAAGATEAVSVHLAGVWGVAVGALLVGGGLAAGLWLRQGGRRIRDGNVARDPVTVNRGLRGATWGAALMAAVGAVGLVWAVVRSTLTGTVPDDAVILGALGLAQLALAAPLLYANARVRVLYPDAMALAVEDKARRE